MSGLRNRIPCALALCCVLIGGAAHAQRTEAIEGHVIGLDEADLVIDLAGKQGAAQGDVVEIWRTLKFKHPVTGRMVTDRFLIGSLKLTQVRTELALARPEGKLTRQAEVGDIVVLHKERAEPTAAPAPALPKKREPAEKGREGETSAPSPSAPTASTDPDEQRVLRLIDSLRGADVTTRIVKYEDYVREFPNSRFSPMLYEEAGQLRKLLSLESTASSKEAPRLERFSEPKTALSGMPLTIGVEIAGPASGAVLHTRRQGEVAYVSMPMMLAGAGYYTAAVPADRMRAPTLDYFIEATTPNGDAVPIVAGSSSPNSVNVHDIPNPTVPPRPEAVVSVLSDYAAWNDPRKQNDYVWQNEGYFGMRFQDVGVRAVRTGFGVYRGKGGSLKQLDELNLSGRDVGLTYGYLEGEFGFSSFTSLVVRAVIGLRRDGVGGGGLGLVRIGNDKRTNLMLGGELLGGIGVRGITQLELATFERVPILLRTEVTNQPAGESVSADQARDACQSKLSDPNAFDQCVRILSTQSGDIGARAIVQVGYRIVPELVVAVRGSYQGRTINHAGPGGGLAVSYTW